MNRQLESGNPLLPSYEQLPPVDLWFAKYNYFVNTFFILPVHHRAFNLQISAKSWLYANPASKC